MQPDRSKVRGESAIELIREAMAKYAKRHFGTRSSVFDHAPAHIGSVAWTHMRSDAWCDVALIVLLVY
jgi:hypothetical protein